MKIAIIFFTSLILMFGIGLSWNMVGNGKPKAAALNDISAYLQRERDEQLLNRIRFEQENTTLRQQVQAYQSALQQIKNQLETAKKAKEEKLKEITKEKETNTAVTNAAPAEPEKKADK